jgi:hypothetical protein
VDVARPWGQETTSARTRGREGARVGRERGWGGSEEGREDQVADA